jgi:hypothetical protein
MPTHLDVHHLGNATDEQLKQAQNSPKDEYGVTHHPDALQQGGEQRLCHLACAERKYFPVVHS